MRLLSGRLLIVDFFTTASLAGDRRACLGLDKDVPPEWIFIQGREARSFLNFEYFCFLLSGWKIFVIFEGQEVHVIQQKQEQSNHDADDPPRTPGRFDFTFTWELKMSFDRELNNM